MDGRSISLVYSDGFRCTEHHFTVASESGSGSPCDVSCPIGCVAVRALLGDLKVRDWRPNAHAHGADTEGLMIDSRQVLHPLNLSQPGWY